MEAGMDLRATGTDNASGLQRIASERLAAHRSRRVRHQPEAAAPEAAQRSVANEAARSVQQAVARRYENTLSYHEFLAMEAERALQQAQAEAEVAARNAKAVAEEQTKLLGELERWRQTESSPRDAAFAAVAAENRAELADALADIAQAATTMLRPAPPRIQLNSPPADSAASVEPSAAASLTVKLYEELGAGLPGVEATRANVSAHALPEEPGESVALDEEIAFRHAPQFDEFLLEPVAVPANVIEFPRQIVAPRKARPRRAEGPLLEECKPEPQLRIFEVEAEQISPAPAEQSSAPEWQSMLLDAQKAGEPATPLDAQLHFGQQPQTAALGLRLAATAVDVLCVGVGFAAFIAVVVKLGGPSLHRLPLPLAGGCAAAALLFLGIVYQMLFFSFSDATPGMRYARIGLCTFGEAHPSRAAMRRRVGAMLLAACPLGLGLAWAWMDEDRLGWHDRMSRMYPRSY
jgi:hypothetical protein